ncbi:helix-turn-helix domain-containing protein [Azohydromonas lata]|uniref:XRE family transcriptional regulator n=1 Tax=Azohydromonas lata TaxID=45677 RepID=A0ABU5INJ1_9BURK|nr:XRE family transcriptional regulator [Azohydromonas lata]MDZ5460441.1 XRE family transcriptional regulator [Azohydromonas lata]
MDVDALLATRIRDLRKARGLTLEQLAELSGVSRSMISLIERRETSPTAAVLNKLADALGVPLPTLFAGEAQRAQPSPVSRRADQPLWTDPASAYTRRHLSPAGIASPLELVEVCFPGGETVVFDNPVRRVSIHQQLWVMEGAMDVSLDDQTWHLATGDCLALELGERITFHNPHPQPARYVLALASNTDISGRSA